MEAWGIYSHLTRITLPYTRGEGIAGWHPAGTAGRGMAGRRLPSLASGIGPRPEDPAGPQRMACESPLRHVLDSPANGRRM